MISNFNTELEQLKTMWTADSVSHAHRLHETSILLKGTLNLIGSYHEYYHQKVSDSLLSVLEIPRLLVSSKQRKHECIIKQIATEDDAFDRIAYGPNLRGDIQERALYHLANFTPDNQYFFSPIPRIEQFKELAKEFVSNFNGEYVHIGNEMGEFVKSNCTILDVINELKNLAKDLSLTIMVETNLNLYYEYIQTLLSCEDFSSVTLVEPILDFEKIPRELNLITYRNGKSIGNHLYKWNGSRRGVSLNRTI